MRSEKEIIALYNNPLCKGKTTETQRAIIIGYKHALSDVLEDPPRFSVVELEKIATNYGCGAGRFSEVWEFLDFVARNKKKVEEILNEGVQNL